MTTDLQAAITLLRRIVHGEPTQRDRYGYTIATDPYREARQWLRKMDEKAGLFELGSLHGKLNRDEAARLRWRAAAILLMEYPWMTQEAIARDVGYANQSGVSRALKRLEEIEWVERFKRAA